MSLSLCDFYYSYCPVDCPLDNSFQCPFFEAEFDDFHQISVWELL